MSQLTPDEVIDKFVGVASTLTVSALGDDMIVIEGGSADLKFLGELLLSMAASESCGFQISPRGAGSAFFSPDSHFGVYVHRRSEGSQPVDEVGLA